MTLSNTTEMADQQATNLQLETLASPRFINSHLPLYLLPPQLIDTCKVGTLFIWRIL